MDFSKWVFTFIVWQEDTKTNTYKISCTFIKINQQSYTNNKFNKHINTR